MIITLLIALVSGEQRFGIKYPPSLADQTNMANITFNIANFGFVPYGQKIAGVLTLATPLNFCDLSTYTQYNSTTTNNGDQMRDAQILLVKRGHCTFYTKALNAQKTGYQMLIIVDDRDEKVDDLNLISLNNTEEIDIPAIMISLKDGNTIIDYMSNEENKYKNVRAYIRFPESFKTKKVDYQYWFSAMDASSYQFLEQFYPFHMQMTKQVNFTPHYAMIRCGHCAQENYSNRDNQCLSGGRYCAPDPDGDGPKTGQDAVKEIVRQLCIYKIDPTKWWDFAIKYAEWCLVDKALYECEKTVMNLTNLNITQVETCVNESFVGSNPELDDNTLLKNEYEIYNASGIRSWPVLFINGLKYKGSLTVPTYTYNYQTGAQELLDTNHFGPLQAICRSFEDDSLPTVCKKRMIGYINDGEFVEHGSQSDTWIVWVVVITTMVLLMICTTYMYRRMFMKETNEKINQEVNIHLAQYYALNEQEKSMRK